MKRKSDRARTKPSGSQNVSEPFTQTEREGLRVLIEEVLNLSRLVDRRYAEGIGMAAAPPMPAPMGVHAGSAAPKVSSRSTDQVHKDLSEAREGVYKTNSIRQDAVIRLSNLDVLDPGFLAAVGDAENATHAYASACEFYLNTLSGIARS